MSSCQELRLEEGTPVKGIFLDDGAIPFLDCGGTYTTSCVCQNSLKCTLKTRILLYINDIPINLT